MEYRIDDLSNEYVHLTNNAIQKNCPDYGKLEDGNQLSFADLSNYLSEINADISFDKHLLPRMKQQA